MRYDCICLSVNDVKASKEFYQDLMGLEVKNDWGINISFNCGISLQQHFDYIVGVPKESIVSRSHNMELVFEDDDFDGFVEKLEKYPNIKLVKNGVVEQPWGQRVIHFYDLDGHIIEVGENFLQVIKRFMSLGLPIEEVAKRCCMSVEDIEKYLS